MALQANASMTFTDYVVEDTGVRMHFVCSNPGPGERTDYYILITDAEWATATTGPQRTTLITNKLTRYFRGSGISTTLNPLIGSVIVI